jgi:hypothetical protein
MQPYLGQVTETYAQLQPIVEEIMAAFGIFPEVVEEAMDDAAEEVKYALQDMKSTFVNSLMDMSDSAEDFGKTISKEIAQNWIENYVLGEKFDQQMEYWQQQYESIIGSGMSEDERKRQLKALHESIIEAKEGYVDQARAIQELLGVASESREEATMNMADKITYDQADQLLGINLAQELTLEQILATLQGNPNVPVMNYRSLQSATSIDEEQTGLINATLQSMAELTRMNGDNLLTQVALANSHLTLIRDYSKAIKDEVVTHMASIDSKLTNLRHL